MADQLLVFLTKKKVMLETQIMIYFLHSHLSHFKCVMFWFLLSYWNKWRVPVTFKFHKNLFCVWQLKSLSLELASVVWQQQDSCLSLLRKFLFRKPGWADNILAYLLYLLHFFFVNFFWGMYRFFLQSPILSYM